MLKSYTSKVLDILPNGDAIIELPPEFCEELGWVEGDTVNITEKNGSIIIEKINDKDKNISLDKT